jgi:hypothetical protein
MTILLARKLLGKIAASERGDAKERLRLKQARAPVQVR